MQLKSSSFLVRYIIGIQGDIFNFTAPDSHERKDLDQPQVTTCMESKCSYEDDPQSLRAKTGTV